MPAPKPGDVIRFSYLWWREHEDGEESGRKYRPCVVVVAMQKIGDDLVRLSVAPVTRKRPASRVAVELPSKVKAHLKLDRGASWVICDELNQLDWPSTDVANVPGGGFSYGQLPPTLLKRIQSALLEAGKSGGLKITKRD